MQENRVLRKDLQQNHKVVRQLDHKVAKKVQVQALLALSMQKISQKLKDSKLESERFHIYSSNLYFLHIPKLKKLNYNR